MKLVFTRIDQNAVAVDVALVTDWLVWLAAVVERDRVGPNVLFSLADFLPVVLPVHALPEKVVVDVVFETRPDRGAWIGGGRVDHDRACGGAAAGVDPAPPFGLKFLL